MPTHLRGTAMVFQDYALWPHMTVFDNIAYGLRMNKTPQNEIDQRVHETMQLVEMHADLLKRRPTELSGGQQQRVALARALIIRPRVCCSTNRCRISTRKCGSACAWKFAVSSGASASRRFT